MSDNSPVRAGPDWKALHSIPTKPKPLNNKILSLLAAEMVEEVVPGQEPGSRLTYARGIVQTWLDKALVGDSEMLKVLLDRIEGKVAQPISGDKDNPLAVAFIERVLVDPQNKA